MRRQTDSTIPWQDRIFDDPSIARLAAAARDAADGGSVAARGIAGSSATFVAAALQRRLDRPLLMVVAHLDDADEAADELLSLGIPASRFPAMELLPGAGARAGAGAGGAGESPVNLELLAERLTLVRRIADGDLPPITIAPIAALMQTVPLPDSLRTMLRAFAPGDEIEPMALAAWLTDAGYQRVESIDSAGEFAIRGDIIDIFPPGGVPSRIDLFGNRIEGIFAVDLDTMGSDRRLNQLEIAGASLTKLHDESTSTSLASLLPSDAIAVLVELIEIHEQARGYYERATDARGIMAPAELLRTLSQRVHALIELGQLSAGAADRTMIDLPVQPLANFASEANHAVAELAEMAHGMDTVVLCQNEGEAQRMHELLEEFGGGAAIDVQARYLHRGFIWGDASIDASMARPLALVPYHELLHRYQTRRRIRRIATNRALDTFLELEPGDFVVHRDHGIARFVGLQLMKTGEAPPEEYLTLEFANRASLHVPASKIELVQKYIGGFHGKPELSILGGKRWQSQKEKVGEAVRDLAAEMLRIQAAREALPGIRFPADTTWQKEFEAEFPYEETEDQLAAIAAVKRDMHNTRPMDRLLCGDVGFGKTEVAMRGAFKAAEFGKQVAILVPTTVLAEQHERTFRERFAGYPFRIESISRFKTDAEQSRCLESLKKGQIDIIIGTHRLLSKDVKFADLGLVVIDEEQRFGVEHKHKLLEFRMTADVLTMSATPIPRTLHMALLGLRDISSLTTPPLDRRAIVTEVTAWNGQRIRQAIERELAREGQVFFVHNRVFNIKAIADEVKKLAPDARVIVGHGQMPPRQLEQVMLKFLRRDADILVSTTIIESGIDIPTANTMFINDAQNFGLSELHQLRGRVGRYKHRAYCYMLLPQDQVLSEVAVKRLRAIENFSMLGAGFRIALRDMEIRGAGNILGADQSGHIAIVGYEMYCQLLEKAVAEMKREEKVSVVDTVIDIGITGSITKGYIPSDLRRMEAYRRINRADSLEALQHVERDLTSAYGELPGATRIVIDLAELRLHATMAGIRSITRHEGDIIFRTAQPSLLEQRMRGAKGSLRLVGKPDAEGVTEYYRPPPAYLEDRTILTVLTRRLRGEGQQPSAAPSVGSVPLSLGEMAPKQG
jgi:transcription-repair coupling factor (superfamily II helicase)